MTDSKETPPGMLSLELVRRLCRAERRAARASLASQFTHELGTPLNVLLGRASMVVAATTDKPEVQKNASLVADTGKDIASRLRGLLEREAIPRHDAGAGATAP